MAGDWETRRDPRAPINVEVRVQVNPTMRETIHLSKEVFEATLVDISTVGMGMLCAVFLPKGALLDVAIPRSAFAVPGKIPAPGEKPLEGSLQITGQVVYARPKEQLCQMGVVITQIEEADKKLIQHFVTASERRQAPRMRFQ